MQIVEFLHSTNVAGHSVYFGYDNPHNTQLGVSLEERLNGVASTVYHVYSTRVQLTVQNDVPTNELQAICDECHIIGHRVFKIV